MEIIDSILSQLPLFLILLFRSSGLMISAPVLSSRNIPGVLRIAITLSLALLVFMIFPKKNEIIFLEGIPLLIVLISEIMIGLLMGYVAQLLFHAIQLAGQSIDMQMGFGIVNVMDPQSGLQVPLIGTFKQLLAILVFLIINGHHWLLQALLLSYDVVPINTMSFNIQLVDGLIALTSKMFIIALQIAAPMVGVLFITDFIMGIISRTVPQMNVFLVGMPAKILIGFFVLIIVIPLYIYLLTALFERGFKDLLQILKVLT